MIMTVEQLEEMLHSKEGEHCEFKAAKNRCDFGTLVKYCAALANEGGGDFVLGVTDKRPRKVVGTRAFMQPERTRAGLIQHLRLNIDFSVVAHPAGRVLVFHIPSRPLGTPIKYEGIYWQRQGDSLVHMSEDRLREIFAETGRDFSAEICVDATLSDLDPRAIEDFRRRWIAKSGNDGLANLSREQLLSDVEALVDGRLTYAALVLFGIRKALGRHLAQAEVIFEYRSSDASGPAQQRVEFRQGFFGFYDRLWDLIALRNDIQHFQSGLFVLDVPTFSERPVRDPRFLQFLEKVGREKLELFNTADFLILDAVHREQPIPEHLKTRLQRLVAMGVIEKFGRGRGTRYILGQRYYKMTGKKGVYTRRKGLDRETNKALLLKHIEENKKTGSRLKELMQVLPNLSDNQVKKLLAEMKKEGRIYHVGVTRAALWYPRDRKGIVPLKDE